MSRRALLWMLVLLAALCVGLILSLGGEAPERAPSLEEKDPSRPSDPPSGSDASPTSDPGPLRVALQVQWVSGVLGSARSFDSAQGGRTSSLRGAVTDSLGAPLPGSLRFVAGLNAGAETAADAEGKYEFPALFPGLHQIEISTARGKALREIRLQPDSASYADFPFAAASSVLGRVIDRQGKPIEGAQIRIDDRVAWTDKDGHYVIDGVVPGDCILYAKAENFAYFRQNLSVPPGYRFEPGKVQIVLSPGAKLQGGVYPVGGTEPALLYLVPNLGSADRSFPFEKFHHIEVPAGGSFALENVPTERSLTLLAFHPRSAADPPSRPVLLRGRSENIVPIDFRFTSARPVRGTVRSGIDGKPLAGVSVRLLGANPYASVSQIVKILGPGAGSHLLPMLPACSKEVRTDAEGRFFLEAGDGAGPAETVLLVVEAPGFLPVQRTLSGATIPPESIALYSPESLAAPAALELRFGTSRAVELAPVVNGSAKELRRIGPGETYRLEDLRVGLYRVELRCEGKVVLREENLPLSGLRTLDVRLEK